MRTIGIYYIIFLSRLIAKMGKKYFSVVREARSYRVFFDDLLIIVKRIKKCRSGIPNFFEKYASKD